MTDIANPYETPAEAADSAAATVSTLVYKQTTFGNAVLRWSGVCIVAAAPSFFFGLAVTEGRPDSIVAMLFGIAVFIFAYAFIDVQPFWRRWMSQIQSRQAIITAYAIRCVMSVIIPVGAANDMMCGALCLGSIGSVWSSDPLSGTEGLPPVPTFVVTLAQGLLLNLEVAGMGFLILGIMLAVRNLKSSNRSQSTIAEHEISSRA